MGPGCQPLHSIICSTLLLATCFYFLKPRLDNVHGRCSLEDLDASLSEQETSAMFIMFMDAAIGWVLIVSFSEQQTWAIYCFFVIVMFIVAAVGWVLYVSLFE
jgi:hypothetical protein